MNESADCVLPSTFIQRKRGAHPAKKAVFTNKISPYGLQWCHTLLLVLVHIGDAVQQPISAYGDAEATLHHHHHHHCLLS